MESGVKGKIVIKNNDLWLEILDDGQNKSLEKMQELLGREIIIFQGYVAKLPVIGDNSILFLCNILY